MSTTPQAATGAAGLDMSQFYQVFFEEAGEHLAEMEKLLLRIDPANPTDDELNAIFRAAHSIKGGAAMFGFADITQVTHEAESLLDRVRKRTMGMTTAIVDAMLATGDVLKAQLASRQSSGQPGDAAEAADMCTRIRALMNAPAGAAAPAAATPPPAAVTVAVATASPAASSAPVLRRHYEIRFPAPTKPSDQTAVARLLDEVRSSGQVEEVLAARAVAEVAPAARAARPSKPVARGGKKKAPPKSARAAKARPAQAAPADVCWRLRTNADEGDVWGLFAFSMDPDKVSIKLLEELPAPAPIEVPRVAPAMAVAVPAPVASAPATAEAGFGFFDEPAPAAGDAAQRSPGRRASDQTGPEAVRTGRRDSDKVAVSAQAESLSIRVEVEKVDLIINQVGELVITQAMLAQSVAQLDPVQHQTLLNALRDLQHNTRDLQESVMSIRMMPIAFVFNRFPRMVRDLAGKLGKKAELATVGEGTELDKGLIEKITDPLTHLVRNSIDHGIESPEQRRAAGKTEHGTIILKAAHQGGSIVIEVIDDGKGLDRARILAKAKERGLPVSDAMADQEVWQLIFEAGFSTAEVVTDVSGRGVGMDVVKRNISKLGGKVEIQSTLGQGTRMTVRLPLTLAIMDGMNVGVDGETYIIPLASVVESMQPESEQIRTITGQGRVIQVRNEFLPVVSLRQIFGMPPRGAEVKDILVIVESEGGKTALVVDELLGQYQVVVKNLENNYRKVPGTSGATILGDGTVALILDVGALVRRARH